MWSWVSRGLALSRLGRKSKGLTDLQAAVERARKLGAATVFLRAAAALLSVAGDDAVAAEAHRVAAQTAAALPGRELRDQFEAFVSELF